MELKGHDERVEQFRRGDRDLLRRLYRAHRDDVEGMLRSGFTFTSNGETYRFRGFRQPFRLREKVQDSFIHAFRERVRKGYDPSRAYRPYLMTVVKNHLIDHFRRRQLEDELFVAAGEVAEDDESEQEALERMADGSERPTPETASLRRELAEMLRDFLEELSETDRAIVRHYMMGEATQREMADKLETNRNHVRKRIRMIRRELLGHLKREDFVGGANVDDVLRRMAEIGWIGATA